MSVLYLRSRPIIAFDATNPNHRQWYADFVKHRGWGRCPVRFIAESLEVDLVTFINSTIEERHFHIQKVELKKPYSAANAGSRPFGIPAEGAVWQWANRLVEERWGKDPYRTSTQMFNELFES